MGPRLKFSLWLAALFGAVAAVVAAVGLLMSAGLEPGDRRVFARVLEDRGPLLAFIALLVFIACAALLRWLFAHFVEPLRALAEQTVIVATANIEHRVAAAHALQERRRAHAARLAQLTQREREVLDLVVAGRMNREIAESLDISIKTVEAHRAKIMEKLEVDSVAELVQATLAGG